MYSEIYILVQGLAAYCLHIKMLARMQQKVTQMKVLNTTSRKGGEGTKAGKECVYFVEWTVSAKETPN